ncbi:CU044_5270 family protein [Micromonospora sp. WMMD723]|uniref:CU044_5270 family protein n=1 Tax=unclassified Micromonospora TaxID=2617518 RepID=UPI003B931BF4
MKLENVRLSDLDPARDIDVWPAAPHIDWPAESTGSSRPSPRWGMTRRPLLSATVAGAIVLGAGVVATQLVGPTDSALAATPAPLHMQYDQKAPSAHGALLDLASVVSGRAVADEQRAGRFSFVQVGQWSLNLSSSRRDGTSVAVVPQVVSTWRAADGSGKVITVSLDPSEVGAQPTARTLVAAAEHKSGEIDVYSAGQLASVVTEPVPHDVNALAAALYAHQPRENGPQSAVRAVADLYRTTTVDRQVRIAVLQFLASTDGVLLRGQVTDRLGRQGMAVSVDSSNGSTRDLLVFDQDSGWLLAYESIFLKRPSRLPVKVPAVFSYVLFLEQERRPDMS